jgi:hypothetical protein
MAYVHKPGTFSLFKNDKGENANRPDYRGEGKDLAGNDIEISAWIKGTKPKTFLSCVFKVKGAEQTSAKQPVAATGGKFDDMEDDLPF